MKPRLRVLYEDVGGHEQWVRGLLDVNRIPLSNVRFEAPVKDGSKEQWVREQLPRMLEELRRDKHQRNLWLVVVADADLKNRRAILEAEIAKAGLDPLSEQDRVVFLIPARNGETWGWCFLGNRVDEITDYKREVENSSSSMRELARTWRTLREGEPPSLLTGRVEWARLP
ncbi:MAG: hypothetical protein JNM17_29875 [Archangium sp.]|nr:hypothetical protein [Archangium sp.]